MAFTNVRGASVEKHIWGSAAFLSVVIVACSVWVVEQQKKVVDSGALWSRDQCEQMSYLLATVNSENSKACWDIFNGYRASIDSDIGDRPSKYVDPKNRKVFTREPIYFPVDQSEAESGASGTEARSQGR